MKRCVSFSMSGNSSPLTLEDIPAYLTPLDYSEAHQGGRSLNFCRCTLVCHPYIIPRHLEGFIIPIAKNNQHNAISIMDQ